MRAAVLEEHGEPLAVREVDEPEPGPSQAIVETEACGVCRSDWHAWQGEWEWMGIQPQSGQILGHEPAGTVTAVGDKVETIEPGDRVTVPFHMGDGSCPYCQSGHSNVCDTQLPLGFFADAPGAFAEKFPVRQADFNATKLPDSVDSVEMAGLGCRFMTAYHGLVDQADIRPGDTVAIHGCGGVGLSAVHIADAVGADPIAVDLDDEKLDRAENLGASATINAREVDDVPGEVHAANGGVGTDVSVDALGIAETCRNSLASLGKLGTHVQIGLTTDEEAGEISLPVDNVTLQELEFVGSYGMPLVRYDELFGLIERGRLEPEKIIGDEIGLDDVSDTLDAMTTFDTVGIPVITSF